MKRMAVIVLLSLLASDVLAETAPQAAVAGPSKSAGPRFQGVLFDALRHLSALLPKQHRSSGDPTQIMALGIRERRSPSSEPGLGEDMAEDLARQRVMRNYTSAQRLLEEGQLEAAEAAFATFVQNHADSDLLPNARFGQALAMAARGDAQRGKAAMEAFAHDYPQHPLAGDARRVAAALQ
ncbi:tetratricopeptide repeat protein [Sulfurivermis fontis]|uniref:tetratricopeptide repeat protein n=1 Tax=Sulfurivermis fontis TaxID=1972068 RepID=UPI000FDB8D39|nr:tetratricopeptide repeat protein [Sulfurivermis fontis]